MMNWWLVFFFGIRLVIIFFMTTRLQKLKNKCSEVRRRMGENWIVELNRYELATRGAWLALRMTLIMEAVMTAVLYKAGVFALFFKVG